MNVKLTSVAATLALLLGTGAASAGALVTFEKPDQYSDFPYAAHERERLMKGVQQHFDVLAAKLPAGQSLKVDVLDINLAGRVSMHNLGHPELRVVGRGADWPHMTLRYTVSEGDRVIKSGQEVLADQSYMERLSVSRYRDDALRYEKEMLDQWFKTQIAAR